MFKGLSTLSSSVLWNDQVWCPGVPSGDIDCFGPAIVHENLHPRQQGFLKASHNFLSEMHILCWAWQLYGSCHTADCS